MHTATGLSITENVHEDLNSPIVDAVRGSVEEEAAGIGAAIYGELSIPGDTRGIRVVQSGLSSEILPTRDRFMPTGVIDRAIRIARAKERKTFMRYAPASTTLRREICVNLVA